MTTVGSVTVDVVPVLDEAALDRLAQRVAEKLAAAMVQGLEEWTFSASILSDLVARRDR